MSQRIERTKVFVSYSHQDAKRLKRLQVHLRPLERDYDIELWDDTRIAAGSVWKREIDNAVLSCKLAVLIITADFLASDFIANQELSPILDAAATPGGPVIVPVIVSASRFARMRELSQFQAVNDPARPLADLGRGEQERIWDKVVQKIEDVFLGGSQESSEETMVKHARSDQRVQDVEKTKAEAEAPRFLAEFVTDSNGELRRSGRKNNHYEIRLFISDAPVGTRKVTYELHETYLEPIREAMKGRRDFEEYITSYGDFIVNIKLVGDSETNLNDWLSSALQNYYGENASPEVAKAIKILEEN